jgi:hypothetical protein
LAGLSQTHDLPTRNNASEQYDGLEVHLQSLLTLYDPDVLLRDEYDPITNISAQSSAMALLFEKNS